MPGSFSYEDEDERRVRVIAVRDAIAAGTYVVDLDALATRLVLVEREWVRAVLPTSKRPRQRSGR